MKYVIRTIAVMSVAAVALLLPVRAALAASPPDAKTVQKSLEEVKKHAAEANFDAATLDTYRRSSFDARMYAQLLNHMKEHANDLFQDYYELQRVRDGGSPAQQEAIDRLEPMVRDMATELTNTIQLLNEHQERVSTPVFRKQVHLTSTKIDEVYQTLCECTGKNAKV